MKFLDYTELLDGEAAQLALLSTYQFDPDFFERRLLRGKTLSKARRIAVFVDARHWVELLKRDVPARWLNRRYLVIPVERSSGVFHPKLSVVLTANGGQVICGSNNLTRAGCSSNLELLNAVPFRLDSDSAEGMNIAREAFRFFERASEHTDEAIGRIALDWLAEARATSAWLSEPVDETAQRQLQLVDTYHGSLWPRIVQTLQDDAPQEFLIISPFHDHDSTMAVRLAQQWPAAKIEMVVQQDYTNLDVGPLKKLKSCRLAEIHDSSRRIHAKLIAWRGRKTAGCIAGSANFTTAALEGRNVEACLLLRDAGAVVDALFDGSFKKRALAFDDFSPGDAEEPEAETSLPILRIDAAVLGMDQLLHVTFSHQTAPAKGTLRLSIRTPSETRPRASISLPDNARGAASLTLPDNVLGDAHGTLLATLSGEIEGVKVESFPVWVIQESRLTHEPGDGSSSSKGTIQDTGEGLPEYLDELGKRDGVSAVVEYLRQLNIRFVDGGGGGPGLRKFRLKIRDPFHADIAPEWLMDLKGQSDDLEAAIYEFVERHQKRRLQKHAERGNLNGMENFLDILTALVRLLYVYYKRGVTKRGKLIGRFCTFIEMATMGNDSENEACDGYLYSLYDNLDGDEELLQNVCRETSYLAEVRAVLLLVQSIRFDPSEKPLNGKPATRPRQVLEKWSKCVTESYTECGLQEPTTKEVRQALESYRMLSEDEIARLLQELPWE